MTEIINNGGRYCKVIHISDIHIRLSTRFKEYNQVFKLFTSQIQEIEDAVIVITGDFFHTKNELTPDCMMLAISFLRSISKIHPVIIIPGNHDLLLNNQEKCDSITAILHRRNLKNVFYLKESGIFRFNNLLILHNSLFGESDWIDPIPHSHTDTLIALYHGMVGKCITNTGMTFSSTLSLSKFKGADIVCLGDIHHHQYLAPHIAYAGSMISQNFNETDEHHGFILWDIPSKSSQFYILPNEYAYRQIDVYGNDTFIYLQKTYTSLDKILQQLHKNTHLQIIIHSSQVDISSIKKESISFSPRIRHTHTQKNVIPSSIPDNKKDMFQILREYLLDTNMSKDIDYYINHIRENVVNETQQRVGNIWSLLDLKFDNLFGYGENNQLIFPENEPPKIIGIFGNNSVGKSTLVDILLFMLYGRISRYASGNSIPKELIHEKQNAFSATLRIRVGTNIYRIHKKGKRDSSNKIKLTESIHQEYIQDESIILENLTEEHRIKTDKIIRDMIGPMDQISSLCLCLQSSEKGFKDMTQKERKEFLFRLFQLDGFETYRQTIHSQLKEMEIQSQIHQQTLSSFDISTSQDWLTTISTIQKEYNEKCLEKEQYSHLQKEYTSRISTLRLKQNTHQHHSQQLTQKTSQLQTISQELSTLPVLNMTIQDIDTKRTTLQTNIKQHYKIIKSLGKKRKPITTTNLYCNDFSFPRHLSFQKKSFVYKPSRQLPPQYSSTHPFYYFQTDILSLHLTKINEYEHKQLKLFHLYQQQINNYTIQIEKLSIQHKIIQQEFNTHANVTYNPNCNDCQQNPFHLRKTEIQSQLQKLTFEIEKYRQKIQWNSGELSRLVKDANTIFDTFILKKKRKQMFPQKMKLESFIYEWTKRKEHIEMELERVQTFKESMNIIFQRHDYTIYSQYQKEISRNDTFLSGLDQYLSTKLSNHLLELQIQENDDIIQQYEKELESLHSLFIRQSQSLQKKQQLELDIHQLQQSIIENTIDKNELSHLEMELEKINIQDVMENVIQLEYKSKKLSRDYEIWQQTSHLYSKLKNDITTHRNLLKITDRNGFPLYLLRSYISQFNQYINEILENFIDRYIQFNIDEECNIQFYTKSNDSNMTFHFFGGMESFMIDLATKITFAHFGWCPMNSFFLIDEHISVFDEQHLQHLDSLFTFLKQHFHHILLISHIPTVKNMVDEYILIKKQNGYSRIHSQDKPPNINL